MAKKQEKNRDDDYIDITDVDAVRKSLNPKFFKEYDAGRKNAEHAENVRQIESKKNEFKEKSEFLSGVRHFLLLRKKILAEKKLKKLNDRLKFKQDLLKLKMLDKDIVNEIDFVNRTKKDAFFNKVKSSILGKSPFLILMELRGGKYKLMVIYSDRDKFMYNNGTYIIDDSLKCMETSSGLSLLHYHEDLAIPVGKRIIVNDIKESLETAGVTEVDAAVNPLTLERFIKSEVVQKVLKGAEMDEIFRFLKMMAILSFIGIMAVLLILLKTTGILNSIKIPGLGK